MHGAEAEREPGDQPWVPEAAESFTTLRCQCDCPQFTDPDTTW